MTTTIAEDMIRLTEDMIAASDARRRAVGTLMMETRATLKKFRADRSKMAVNQAKDLAGFAGGLSKEVTDIKASVERLLKDTGSFLNEQRTGMSKARCAWRDMSAAIAKARKAGFTSSSANARAHAAERVAHKPHGKKNTATKHG